ncbi:MAG TPA: hypothetical protein PKJ41_10035 [Bryobacteraceae bacterium]|nr:hypothetical protein [Bryobacteraceae bacterium]
MHARTILAILLAAAAALIFCPQVSAAGPAQAAQAPAAIAAADLWSYTLPGAKFIAGVDWQRAKNSGAGDMLMRKLMAAPGAKSRFAQAGMDFVDNLDRLLVSAPAGAGGGQHAVIALSGRFDRAKLKKSMPAGTAIERMKGIDLFVPPASKGEDMVAGWVSETLMLVGDRESIAGVLDARTGLDDGSLLARAHQMEAENEIWLIADAPPSLAAGTAPGAAKGIEDILSMELGISLRQGLGLKANFTMADAEKAQGAAMMAQMFSAFPASPTQQPSALAAIAKNLRVKVDGTAVRVDLQLPMAQLERAASEARASLEGMSRRTLESMIGVGGGGSVPGIRPAYRAQTATSVPQQSAAPVPVSHAQPAKRTIRIVGLEEGDKEISYTSGSRQ